MEEDNKNARSFQSRDAAFLLLGRRDSESELRRLMNNKNGWNRDSLPKITMFCCNFFKSIIFLFPKKEGKKKKGRWVEKKKEKQPVKSSTNQTQLYYLGEKFMKDGILVIIFL